METINRIEKEARIAAEENYITLNDLKTYRHGYKDGALSEQARAHKLVEALKELLQDVNDWEDYNRDQIDSFGGNEKEMQTDIANQIKKRYLNAKQALTDYEGEEGIK